MAFNPSSRETLVVGRAGLPGRFIVLTAENRIEAVLAKSKPGLAEALERRSPIEVQAVFIGPNDGSSPLVSAPNVKTIDPRGVIIAMVAPGSDPLIAPAERAAWQDWRINYAIAMEAPPYTIAGNVLLIPSQDPFLLSEGSRELFLPVFSPKVQVGELALADLRHDEILVNRSQLRRVRTATRH
jgi:hypothetical protein